HHYQITLDPNLKFITVTVDQADPIQVPMSETVNASFSGHRMAISTLRGITIADETAVPPSADQMNVLALDAVYDQITPGSWVVVTRPDRKDWQQPLATQVKEVQKVSITRYGLSARVTQLILNDPWLTNSDLMLTAARNAAISAQSEQLVLAQEPIADP